MTRKVDGFNADEHSTLRISARVLAGELPTCWALLGETEDETFSGWTVFGLGDFDDDRPPLLDEGDELVALTFAEAGEAIPFVLDLREWGNGEDYPMPMETWANKGKRLWHPWKDTAACGRDRSRKPAQGARLLHADDPVAALEAEVAETGRPEAIAEQEARFRELVDRLSIRTSDTRRPGNGVQRRYEPNRRELPHPS